MGLVLLDLSFRVERSFGIKVARGSFERLGIVKPGDDVTVGQYHDFLCVLCQEQGRPIPPDSWTILVRHICDASGCRPAEVTRDTWLIKDIAPCG